MLMLKSTVDWLRKALFVTQPVLLCHHGNTPGLCTTLIGTVEDMDDYQFGFAKLLEASTFGDNAKHTVASIMDFSESIASVILQVWKKPRPLVRCLCATMLLAERFQVAKAAFKANLPTCASSCKAKVVCDTAPTRQVSDCD